LREGIKLDFKDNAVSVTARLRSTARTKDGTDLASAWEFGRRTGSRRKAGSAAPAQRILTAA
jgi:hypothetical protein